MKHSCVVTAQDVPLSSELEQFCSSVDKIMKAWHSLRYDRWFGPR